MSKIINVRTAEQSDINQIKLSSGQCGDKKDAVLQGFFPLSILARCFGFFPFSNLGRRVRSADELRTKKFTIDVFLTIFVIIIINLSNLVFFQRWPLFFVDVLRDTVHNWFYAVYRYNTEIIFIPLAVFKQRRLVQLFQHVCAVPYGTSTAKKLRSLTCLSYLLITILLIISVTYVLCLNTYYPSFDSVFQQFSVLYGAACIVFTYTYFTAFIVYFNYAFQYHFQQLAVDLDDVVGNHHLVSDFGERLSVIRQRHEYLVMLVEELNDVLSPILTIYICSQSISACVNSYELCYLILEGKHFFKLIRGVSFAFTRIIPLVALCITSNALTKASNLTSRNFNNCSFIRLPRESEFQINLLLAQFKRRKAKITADDIMTVDNRLLAQILGAIITYSVVMLEMSNTPSSSELSALS